MHLVSDERLARLKANKRAYDHLQKYKAVFVRYAQAALTLAEKFPQLKNEETRVDMVAGWITTLDPIVWTLAPDGTTVRELADTYARFVVGHE